MNQLGCFDNSLKEITPDLLKCRKGIQQGSVLYTSSFINNFYCRHKLNKSEHNNTSPIAPKTSPIVRVLVHEKLLAAGSRRGILYVFSREGSVLWEYYNSTVIEQVTIAPGRPYIVFTDYYGFVKCVCDKKLMWQNR